MSTEEHRISLNEAREILGKDADHLSDDALRALIDQLNSLARGFVQAVLNGDAYAVFMEYNRGE
jgi:hypothetical protein